MFFFRIKKVLNYFVLIFHLGGERWFFCWFQDRIKLLHSLRLWFSHFCRWSLALSIFALAKLTILWASLWFGRRCFTFRTFQIRHCWLEKLTDLRSSPEWSFTYQNFFSNPELFFWFLWAVFVFWFQNTFALVVH